MPWVRTRPPRRVSPEPLNVLPALVGLPLATPQRRAAAMAVDLVVVALLSEASGFWLAGGLLLVLLQLRDRGRLQMRTRAVAGWVLVALFVGLAAQQAWQAGRDRHPPRPEVELSDDEDVEREAALRQAADILRAQGLPSAASSVAALASAVAAASAPQAAASTPEQLLVQARQRITQLEEQLAQARRPRPWTLRTEIARLADAVGASFGWSIVYFTLLPAFWNGQTLGKRLLQLQVVELAGQPLTVMRCLRRYGGYAAGMATGGLGFAQVMWDVNRQGLQDRAAHTVVIDRRLPPPAASPPPAAGPAAG
jgi:hypothetical protein